MAGPFTGYVHLDANGLAEVTELSGPSRLATITGVDLKATGQTTLYTVPAGKNAIITDVIPIITAFDAFVTAAIIRIGKAAAYSEWLPLTTLTGLNTINQFMSLNTALAIRQVFGANDVIKVDVQTGAVATTITASFHVLGYLF